MKQLSSKSKIIYGIIILFIIISAIVVVQIGFNIDVKYKPSKRIEIYIKDVFNREDIQKIVDEVLEGEKSVIQEVEVFKDKVSITATDITEEQKKGIVDKVNEKYSLEVEADEVTIENMPHIRIRDIIKPYIIPMVIASVISISYMLIRYNKLGVLRTLLTSCATIIVAQLLLFSVIGITRIPIGDITPSLIIIVYVISLLAYTCRMEKKREEKKLDEI